MARAARYARGGGRRLMRAADDLRSAVVIRRSAVSLLFMPMPRRHAFQKRLITRMPASKLYERTAQTLF